MVRSKYAGRTDADVFMVDTTGDVEGELFASNSLKPVTLCDLSVYVVHLK